MPDDRFIHRRAGHSQKVNMLTDLEHRVWIQYILSADDFGVMRASALTLQADNDHLANRPKAMVQRCIDALVKAGLVHSFEHQNRRYVFQHDWQTWQKVDYPRTTNEPKPPDESVAICDDATRQLFDLHPGGARRKRGEHSGKVPGIVAEHSPLTRAGAPAKRLTAPGDRLTANGSEGGVGETDPPPIDIWARELVNLYPAQGRCGWNLVERPLFDALHVPGATVDEAWSGLKARLEQHKRSHQWRMKGMIPRLDKWLREGLYLQELPEDAPVAEQLSSKTSRTLAAAAQVMRESA